MPEQPSPLHVASIFMDNSANPSPCLSPALPRDLVANKDLGLDVSFGSEDVLALLLLWNEDGGRRLGEILEMKGN